MRFLSFCFFLHCDTFSAQQNKANLVDIHNKNKQNKNTTLSEPFHNLVEKVVATKRFKAVSSLTHNYIVKENVFIFDNKYIVMIGFLLIILWGKGRVGLVELEVI